jgi:hypothetical protein
VFEQNFPVINRSSERDHSGSENICRAELVDLDDAKAPDHVGDKAVDLLKIANVIARQLAIRLG